MIQPHLSLTFGIEEINVKNSLHSRMVRYSTDRHDLHDRVKVDNTNRVEAEKQHCNKEYQTRVSEGNACIISGNTTCRESV